MRRFAAGLRGLGLRREERVLLLMLDSSDWPVAFLGCLYAGVVPVAVNTLLTADDYAYMLEHSARAGRAGVGRAAAGAAGGDGAAATTSCDADRVAAGRAAAPAARRSFESALAAAEPLGALRRHRRRRARLLALLLRLHRPPQGDGAHARQPLLDRGALRQGRSSA